MAPQKKTSEASVTVTGVSNHLNTRVGYIVFLGKMLEGPKFRQTEKRNNVIIWCSCIHGDIKLTFFK